MGSGRFDEDSYASYSTRAATLSVKEVFTQREVHKELRVEDIKVRESRDSADNPCATPIIVALDVTGSMGRYAKLLAAEKLGILMGTLLERGTATDPHLMFLGIGDCVAEDRVPLQATQFEADNRIVQQLTSLYLEGGGGGNNFESYDLAWLFARNRTRTDAWEKRKQKGFLFTIGDEMFPGRCNHEYVKKILGQDCPQDTSPMVSLEQAKERYHVFHVIIEEGNYASQRLPAVTESWQKHLQRRVLSLNKAEYVSELIVSAIAIENGALVDDTIAQWPKEMQGSLRHALGTGQL